jgi:shikimate dehydrogenase
VWGSPISHSLSPALHRAAYAQLGLDWSYDRRDVNEALFSEALNTVADDVIGLSLTMPLKATALECVESRSSVVELLGVANTVLREGDAWALDNTDPWGVVGALDAFSHSISDAWIMGAGATARSVGYALHLTGATRVVVVARNPQRATPTASILEGLGLKVSIVTPDNMTDNNAPDVVVSTLPAGTAFPASGDMSWLTHHAGLLDVAYSPWPSSAATVWAGSPQPVVSGLSMLVHQGVRQVRLFVHGDAERALPEENSVRSAMERAVGLLSA